MGTSSEVRRFAVILGGKKKRPVAARAFAPSTLCTKCQMYYRSDRPHHCNIVRVWAIRRQVAVNAKRQASKEDARRITERDATISMWIITGIMILALAAAVVWRWDTFPGTPGLLSW